MWLLSCTIRLGPRTVHSKRAQPPGETSRCRRSKLEGFRLFQTPLVTQGGLHANIFQRNAGALPIFQDLNTAWCRYLKNVSPGFLQSSANQVTNQPTNPPTNQLFRNSPWALQIGVFQTYADTLLQTSPGHNAGAWSNKWALLWSTDKGRQKEEPLFSCGVWLCPKPGRTCEDQNRG